MVINGDQGREAFARFDVLWSKVKRLPVGVISLAQLVDAQDFPLVLGVCRRLRLNVRPAAKVAR